MRRAVPLLIAVAVVVAGASGLGWSSAGHAADLDDGYPAPRASGADDPRYRDMYEVPPPRELAEPNVEVERSDRDRWEQPAPRRHARRYIARHDEACLDSGGVRRLLRSDGWHDFDDVEFEGRYLHMEAERRASGREFDLTVDACTGEIISAVPHDTRRQITRTYDGSAYGHRASGGPHPPRDDRWGSRYDDRDELPPRYGRYVPRD
ncbi:MAG: hypothetical protein NW217_07880 [Hyphomicrobiaceae bacterium]|nr:hypothetical protein [Hyphomicrobiaceae bacterium]